MSLPNKRTASLLVALFAALVGLVVSLDLVWLHFKVHTDPNYHSFCAMSDSFNCETVAESWYSVFLFLPVAVWGALGYAGLLILLVTSVQKGLSPLRSYVGLLFSGIAVATSLGLAIISYCVICAFCVLCTVTYVVNLVLLIVFARRAALDRPRFAEARAEFVLLLHARWYLFGGAAALLVALMIVYPKYWRPALPSAPSSGEGVTAEGVHWLGAAAPVMTIEEFSDYLCPHCRRGHITMRELLSVNGGKLRIVHRHFPLDNECNPMVRQPFHIGACRLARAAICAGEQERFWDMNDLLYQGDRFPNDATERIKAAAEELGLDTARLNACIDSPRAKDALRRDIDAGLALRITGTPAFVIEGKVYPGRIPDDVLKKAGLAVPERVGESAPR